VCVQQLCRCYYESHQKVPNMLHSCLPGGEALLILNYFKIRY